MIIAFVFPVYATGNAKIGVLNFQRVIKAGKTVRAKLHARMHEMENDLRSLQKEITVTFNPGFIVTLGIMDPTGACTVNLKYKDYTQSSFCCNGFVSFFPFYLFSPNWIQVNKAAKAFQELRTRRASD